MSPYGRQRQFAAPRRFAWNVRASAALVSSARGNLMTRRLSYRRQTGSPFCFRRLLSKADSGTKRRRKLTWRAIFPAA